jgi:hypothetical protein
MELFDDVVHAAIILGLLLLGYCDYYLIFLSVIYASLFRSFSLFLSFFLASFLLLFVLPFLIQLGVTVCASDLILFV